MAKQAKGKNQEEERLDAERIARMKGDARDRAIHGKVDFVAFIEVNGANPNGDPLNGNDPRTDRDGMGLISDVCVKRKIRNRLQDFGESIFVQSDDRADDGRRSLKERADGCLVETDDEAMGLEASEKWIDVRAFGCVMAYKGAGDDKGVSIHVRGPVSIGIAKSIDPIETEQMQITKSVNGNASESRGSDTMGMKSYVPFGLYKLCGSVNVQLARRTGFSEADKELLKKAILTMFENDASSARPEGTMRVARLYWFEQDSDQRNLPRYSSYLVHHSVEAGKRDGVVSPAGIADYEFFRHELNGLEPEVLEG